MSSFGAPFDFDKFGVGRKWDADRGRFRLYSMRKKNPVTQVMVRDGEFYIELPKFMFLIEERERRRDA